MEAVVQHVTNNVVGYAALAAFLVPFLIIFRRHVWPLVFHTCEVIVYSVVFHVVFGGIVRFLAWFRDASSFEHYDTTGVVNQLSFTTPMTNFWIKELYVPQGLYFFELAAFAAIVFIVIWFRPLGTQNYYRGKGDQPGARSHARATRNASEFDRQRRRMAYDARYQPRHR